MKQSKLFGALSCIIITLMQLQMIYSGQHKILLSSNSMDPPGIYGSDGINPDGFEYASKSYYLTGVFNASYPIVSPDGGKFARFEENSQGMKLIIRKTNSGDLINEIKINGTNPQWFPDGNNLFFETPPSGNKSFCWKIDVNNGGYSKIVELTYQYYPPSDPGLGASVLSQDGRDIAYIRLSDTLSFLTPYIMELKTGIEKYAYPPATDGVVDGENKRQITIAAGPAAPNTIRHLSLNSNGTKLAMYGTVSWVVYYDPNDTTKFSRQSKSGIFVIDLLTKEITTIYECKNFVVEHSDIFYFSRTGNMLAFNAVINNEYYIYFANADAKNSARAAYPGSFICGQSSKQYWALNPWSPNGKKILYRNNVNNGDMISATPCGDESKITSFKKQVFIQDAQWADFNIEKTPEPGWTMVDPVPELVINNQIRNDRGLIQSCKHYASAIAADGTAKLVIRFETGYSKPMNVRFSLEKNLCAIETTGNENEDGSFSYTDDQTESKHSTIENISYDYNGKQVTDFVYNAPLDFVRVGTNDDEKGSRFIEISAMINEDVYHIPIMIVRPPVYLIHGLWSSKEVWDGFTPLNGDVYDEKSRFTVFRADYKKRNNLHIDTIVGAAGIGVVDDLFESIEYYRNNMQYKTACAKADVVGHSLGGIIARSMPVRTNKKYFKRENYGKGLIHKLITIDTPHRGSGYADGLIKLFNKSREPGTLGYYYTVKLKALNKMLNLWGVDNSSPIEGGAIHDLTTDSPALELLNDTVAIEIQPPLHTIVGLATFEQEMANQEYVYYLTSYLGKGLGGYSVLFGSNRHDLIVSEESQIGSFDANPDRMTVKSGITHSSDYFLANSAVGEKSGNAGTAINLLNMPRNSKYFTENGRQFGKISIGDKNYRGAVAPEPLNIVEYIPLSKKGINISRLWLKDKYFCGDTIKIVAEPDSGFNLVRVFAAGFGSIQIDTIPPFEFDFIAPLNYQLGKTEIMVLGTDSLENFANDLDSNDLTDMVQFQITTKAKLDSIRVTGDKRYNFRINQTTPRIFVRGYFNDGITRNITKDDNTSYMSSNPEIALVDSGEIKLKSPGVTRIEVSNSGKTDTFEIVVKPDNVPPEANAGESKTVKVDMIATLDGSASLDPDGGGLNYLWEIYDKPKASKVSLADNTKKLASLIPDVPGYYVLKLTVEDNKNETGADYVSVLAEKEANSISMPIDNNNASISVQYRDISNKLDVAIMLADGGEINVNLLNILGKRILNIYNGFAEPGNKSFSIDATNIVPGCYMLTLEKNGKTLSQKVIITR